MKILGLIFFALCILSCGPSKEIVGDITPNPCEDVEYQKLRKIKYSEMTSQQQASFDKMDKECKRFIISEEAKSDKSDWILIGAVGTVAAALIILGIFGLVGSAKPH